MIHIKSNIFLYRLIITTQTEAMDDVGKKAPITSMCSKYVICKHKIHKFFGQHTDILESTICILRFWARFENEHDLPTIGRRL